MSIYHGRSLVTDRFAKLNSLSVALVATLDLAQVLERTAHHLSEALPGAAGAVILLLDTSPGCSLTTFGQLAGQIRPDDVCADLGLAGRAVRSGQFQQVDDARGSNDVTRWERALTGAGQQALLCVPLASATGVCGVIEVAGPPGLLGSEDVQFLGAIAAPVALAIEKARLHANVARSEAHYRALLEHARDAVLLLDDGQTTFRDTNAAAQRLSGYTREQLAQVAPARLITPTSREKSVSLSDVLRQGVAEFEALLHTCDGGDIPVSVGVSDVNHDGARYLLLIVRDMSERQRLVQRLIQAEKLAGMGRMTASIAHEINNPLQALQSSLNLVLKRPIGDEKREQILHMARDQVEQLAVTVQQMLDLYRPSRDGMRPISPHEVLEAALGFTAARLEQHQIAVVREWEERLPRVRGVSSHLKQVCLSLLLNAIDAMPDGGTIHTRTYLTEHQGARSVVIEIADSGPGITGDDLKNIFEPFYTTRAQRTGMGLAISYSIIEQHDGTLTASASDKGATFRITLPAL